MDEGIWPACGGKTGALVRDFDWSSTALGPARDWPSDLRALVQLVLMNPAPSALLWGPQGTLVYNDGYAAICGARHPRALGMSVFDVWPEAAEFNGAVLATGRAGAPQTFQNIHFVLERDGVPRDAWFDLYYAPVCERGGVHEGVLATVVETTGRVQAEQAREAQARALLGDMQFIRNLFQTRPPVDYRSFGAPTGVIPVSTDDAAGRIGKIVVSYKWL